MNISLEKSNGWVRIVLFLSMRQSRVGLLVVLKIALLPFLGFWLINFRNLIIDLFMHVCECLVMFGKNVCLFTDISKFSDPVINWEIGRRGWYRGVGVVRYGLDYRMYLPIGVVFCNVYDFLY